MKALLVDFDDSFTWNLVQELEDVGIPTTVLHWQDFDVLPSQDLLVLGPGPGHPDDYQRIFPLISEWLEKERPFFAICLGHQIFWRLQGEEVVRSKNPAHGQKIRLDLTPEWRSLLKMPYEVWVQRYNSLAVPSQGIRNPKLQNFVQEDEIFITIGHKILTYQFHPESVGTTYRRSFFMPLKKL